MKTTMTKRQWQRLARQYARLAHTEYFPAHRGTFVDEGLGVLVYFDNSPCAGLPDLRGEQLAEFREYLRGRGIKELACATYPEDGYTYALVVEAAPTQQAATLRKLKTILRASLRRALARTPVTPVAASGPGLG
jgi:hypothetical protein